MAETTLATWNAMLADFAAEDNVRAAVGNATLTLAARDAADAVVELLTGYAIPMPHITAREGCGLRFEWPSLDIEVLPGGRYAVLSAPHGQLPVAFDDVGLVDVTFMLEQFASRCARFDVAMSLDGHGKATRDKLATTVTVPTAGYSLSVSDSEGGEFAVTVPAGSYYNSSATVHVGIVSTSPCGCVVLSNGQPIPCLSHVTGARVVSMATPTPARQPRPPIPSIFTSMSRGMPFRCGFGWCPGKSATIWYRPEHAGGDVLECESCSETWRRSEVTK